MEFVRQGFAILTTIIFIVHLRFRLNLSKHRNYEICLIHFGFRYFRPSRKSLLIEFQMSGDFGDAIGGGGPDAQDGDGSGLDLGPPRVPD